MIKKEGETMDRDTIFLYVIAVIASCFGLINCIQFFLKGNKTAQTVGTIISFKTINPEKLYSFSILRIIVSLIVAAICIAAAIFNLV
ncbi:MAG: hypothetical protein V8R41_04780 [Dorea formicigenerans]